MESWQKTFITKNLTRFAKETIVNSEVIVILIAKNVLCDDDVQKLETTGDREGNTSKAKVLYDILFTREKAYKAIGRATFKTKQTGVFILLLKGLVKYLFQQTKIDLEEETIDETLEAECLTNDVWQFFSAKVDKGTLYENNWIPPPHPFYIPRHISNRIKLKPQVFKRNCSDVFVFTGITRPELSKLAEPSRTALSSQVINKNMTTIRFVLLEHEHQWEMLRSVWSETPIHLIQFNSDSSDYILHNSTRSSEVVSNHVPPHLRDKTLYVTEEQFLTQISKEGDQRTICICDTPGMGKTLLIENMARQIQQLQSSRMIAVIGLQKFVEQTLASPQHFNINSDQPIQILLKYMCPFRLTSNLLEKALESNQIQLELFMDGFDEIPKELVQATQEFMKSITENRANVNLIVTSRPHMQTELERTLKGVAYDILPFSEENQAEFLVRFWQKFAKRPKELNSDKLKLFGRECLNCLKKSLTEEEGKMMGIPLQCLLLATVNLTNAELYCHQNSTLDIDDFISPTSLFDMYSIYFEMGIDRAVGIYGHNNYKVQSSNNTTKSFKRFFWRAIAKLNLVKTRSALICQDRQKLKAFHVWMALQLLVPDFAEDYRQRESISDFESEKILACGILQNCSSDKVNPTAMTFVHRTFAEYLVAEHFAEIITSKCKSINKGMLTKYIRYFVTDVLSTQPYNTRIPYDWEYIRLAKPNAFKFSNSAVVYFLNANLQSITMMSSSELLSQNLVQFLAAGNLGKILSACITSSYANIIRLFNNLLKPIASNISSENQVLRDLVVTSTSFEGPIDGFSLDQCCLIVPGYLSQAAQMSNVNVLEELYSLFEDCLHENLNEFCSRMPQDAETPLHFAVQRVDYSMVEYFVNQVTLPGRRILFSLPKYGDYNRQTAIEICELLLRNDTSIMLEQFEENWDNITYGIILHVRDVELIKFLVQQGADVRTTRRFSGLLERHNNTVLTFNAMNDYMQVDKFRELCRFLLYEIKAYDLFTPNLPFWNDPLPEIIHMIDDDTLISILKIPGISIDGKDDDGNNLVLASIKGNGELSIVKHLVDLGVDVFAKNKKGQNALHLAVKSGNCDTTEYLLHLGFNLEERDQSQNTALHKADGNIEIIKFLILKNANILAVNHRGDNIAHRALAQSDKIDNRALILYLISQREGTELFKMRNKKGRTPLHEWIANRHSKPDSETMQLVLQTTGEDVNVIDSKGWSMFLHAAEKKGSVACLQCLKTFGANHNAISADGKNALHYSAKWGFLESTKYLVSIGVSRDLKDNKGETPLILYLIRRMCRKIVLFELAQLVFGIPAKLKN